MHPVSKARYNFLLLLLVAQSVEFVFLCCKMAIAYFLQVRLKIKLNYLEIKKGNAFTELLDAS